MRSRAERRISRGCRLITSTIGARLDAVVLDQLAEHRRLQDAEPDPQPDADQDDAEQERDRASPRWRSRRPTRR